MSSCLLRIFFVTYFEKYYSPESVSNRSSSEKNSIHPILICHSSMVGDHFYPKSSSDSNSKKNYCGQNNQCRKLKIAPMDQKFSVVYKTDGNKGFFLWTTVLKLNEKVKKDWKIGWFHLQPITSNQYSRVFAGIHYFGFHTQLLGCIGDIYPGGELWRCRNGASV